MTTTQDNTRRDGVRSIDCSEFLRICGHTVTVITESPKAWSTNGIGRSDTGRAMILLKDDLPAEVRQSTLLHEIIHMIADMNSLTGLTDNETTVAVLANAMFAWMRDNKEAVAVMADIYIPNVSRQESPGETGSTGENK